MKSLKEHADGIILCLFELIVGILLLINPVGFTAGIITIAGIVLMIMGLIEVVKYFKMRADEAMLSQALTKGLLSLLAGCFCAFKTEWFITTFPVFTIIYGVLILVTGINKIQRTVDILRQKDKTWYGSSYIGRPLCPWNAGSENTICGNDRHGNCFYSLDSCCRRLHWRCGRRVYDHDGLTDQGRSLPDLPCDSSTVGGESHISPCCGLFDGFACNLGACRSYNWRRRYKSRKGMKQMERLQPQMVALQQKYANDKEKLNQKTAELYQREHVSPMSGCLPMLISMVILFVMFSAMRQSANLQMARQTLNYLADGAFQNERFLWIRNLWMPDSPFAAAMPTANQLAAIPAESWASAYASLTAQQIAALPSSIAFDFSGGACAATVEAISAYMSGLPEYISAVQTIPQLTNINLLVTRVSVFVQGNGWLVLPVLSCVTQILMTKLTQNKNQQNAANGNMAMMNLVMPLFSLVICLGYNSSFALYWVVSNCFAILQTIVLNRILDKKTVTQE